jgi:hypothetical protein
MGTVLGVRELAGAVEGYSGYGGPAGARALESLNRFIRQVDQGELDAAFWRSLNASAGALLHYPAAQVQRTVEGVAAIADERTQNPLVVVGGPPR